MKKRIVKYKKGIVMLVACVLIIGAGVGLRATGLLETSRISNSVSTSTVNSNHYIEKGDLINLTTGKIIFGKNENGSAQEWYLLGKDANVSGNNVVMVAANPMKDSQVFESDGKRNESDSAVWADCQYEESDNVAEVHPNHYGASELRAQLKKMVTDTAYFSDAEQALLNATTITTYDTRNRVNYTTTDKLYLLANVNGKLMAGSDDNIEVQTNQTDFFWLRTATGLMEEKGTVLTANSKNTDTSVSVEFSRAVLPVTNLDVSSISFASAATPGQSGAIDENAAMILRMDDSEKAIGSVRYNSDSKMIVATRDTAATNPVSLMVVGNGTIGGQTCEWCYTAEVSNSTTVTVAMIQEALGLTSEVALEECKIWIESTDSTDNLTYAKGAFTMLPGDYNGDGSITKADTYLCKRYVLGDVMDVPVEVANANESIDGQVNSCDIVWMMKNEQVEVKPNPEDGWGPIM